jgi:seryl-tRNA synthetase
VEGLRHRQRVVGEEIARLGRAKADTSALRAEMKGVSDSVKELEAGLAETEAALQKSLESVPNLPDESVPVGDPSANAEVRRVGTPRAFDFTPKAHWDLGPELGILDFERASKISGARFAVLWDDGARLERALASFMLDLHTRERGTARCSRRTSSAPRPCSAPGTCPSSRATSSRPARATATSTSSRRRRYRSRTCTRDEMLEAADLPKKYVSFTPCFRSEAGSYGKDVRGLIRQHQFHKVEMVKLTTPESSMDEHEAMVSDAEEVLKRLDLPYRVVLLSTGDMGFSAAKTYDLEVWLPGQDAYREISSCSNCTDFQARRANLRYRPEPKGKPRFVHTLNGSGLAVGRTLIAVLENHQQADGSVRIPDALRPYLGGQERIVPPPR